MRDAAAERAARSDRIVRDVAHHRGQEPPERPVHHRLVEGGMAHAGADAELVAIDRQARKRLDAVDVDEVGSDAPGGTP